MKFFLQDSFHKILHFPFLSELLHSLSDFYFGNIRQPSPDARVVYSSDALNRTFSAYGAHIFGPFFDVWIGAEYKWFFAGDCTETNIYFLVFLVRCSHFVNWSCKLPHRGIFVTPLLMRVQILKIVFFPRYVKWTRFQF